MIIVAANAGGAWSPIGDITTTMLWIGKKVTPIALLKYLIIPSLVCMLIPTYVVSRYKVFQGEINPIISKESENKLIPAFKRKKVNLIDDNIDNISENTETLEIESDTNIRTEEQIRQFLDGNLCRCTGYQNIIKSIIDYINIKKTNA